MRTIRRILLEDFSRFVCKRVFMMTLSQGVSIRNFTKFDMLKCSENAEVLDETRRKVRAMCVRNVSDGGFIRAKCLLVVFFGRC